MKGHSMNYDNSYLQTLRKWEKELREIKAASRNKEQKKTFTLINILRKFREDKRGITLE